MEHRRGVILFADGMTRFEFKGTRVQKGMDEDEHADCFSAIYTRLQR